MFGLDLEKLEINRGSIKEYFQFILSIYNKQLMQTVKTSINESSGCVLVFSQLDPSQMHALLTYPYYSIFICNYIILFNKKLLEFSTTTYIMRLPLIFSAKYIFSRLNNVLTYNLVNHILIDFELQNRKKPKNFVLICLRATPKRLYFRVCKTLYLKFQSVILQK